MIKNYFKVAIRNFWRHKLFTLINIIGLSIGISASLVIYLIVHYDFTFDQFHKDGDRIYRVVTDFTFSGEPAYNAGVCGPLPGAVKSEVTGVEVSAPVLRLFQPDVFITSNRGNTTRFKSETNITFADKGYFALFNYKWVKGSPETSLTEPYQVVITTDIAKMYFPGVPLDQVPGRTITYDSLKTTVSGIVQPLTGNTDFTFHDFISYATCYTNRELKAGLRLHNWGGTSVKSQLFIKLFSGTAKANVEKQLNNLLRRNNPPTPESKNKTQKFRLQELSDIHFNQHYTLFDTEHFASRSTLYGLLAIAAFILLLGCINFINLSTAQSAQRAKEVGIRKTLGSSRAQLVVQILTETFFVTLIAIVISTVMAPVLLNVFRSFIPEGVKAGLLYQPAVLLFLVVLAVSVSLLSGFYPAVILSGYKPVAVLKNQAQNSSKTRTTWLRKSLTVSQFVIAQFFIMATLLVSKQVYYAVHKDLGFKKDAVVMINTPLKFRESNRTKAFMHKLREIPQVEMISLGNDAPSSENTGGTEASYRDGKKEIKLNIAEKFGDANYIRLYKIKLLAGRNLMPGDTNKAFLINETFARTIGFKDPHDAVGKQINNFNGDMNMLIIGVVSDFHQESLHEAVAPLVIFTSTDKYFNGIFHIGLKPETANGSDWKKALAGMNAAWKMIYPEETFNYQFVDESVAELYKNERHMAMLLNWATGLSILISCLGLLGLAIYTTNQRTKEIGVRKVLGATVTQVVALLSVEIVWLITLAFVIVTPFAWLVMNKWIQGFADRTTISWWIFALSAGGMLLAAVITSSFQTIKAAMANPVSSLRSE
jgi:putative ABC transport system permease protein